MIPRFYIDAPLREGAEAPLSAAQGHHVVNVLRKGAGEPVRVFNERDGEFDAVLSTLSKSRGAARLRAKIRTPAAEPDLWLLFAPVKKDAIDFIIEKATELGVAVFHPVITERTVANRVNLERLQANAVEAAQQCGRLSVPAFAPVEKLAGLLAGWPQERRLLYCDEAGDDPHAPWGGEEGRAPPVLEALRGARGGPWAVLTGPEGGFSPGERAHLRSLPFVVAASLGPRILRADTAAAAALALWQAALGDLRRASLTKG